MSDTRGRTRRGNIKWTAETARLLGTDTRCAILTEPAAPSIANIHDRMPVMLDFECWRDWLDPERTERSAIRAAARRIDPETLTAWPISTAANKPANNGPELIERLP